MTDIAMCATTSNVLQGLQARVGKFDTVTSSISGYEMLSVFGKLTGVCKIVNMAPTEYVTDLSLGYDEVGVNQIQITTSAGQILAMGTPSTSTFSVVKPMKFTELVQLIGFYGTATGTIKSLAQIVVNTNCTIPAPVVIIPIPVPKPRI